jgi:probable HAF family extracellular repeat protein
MQIKPALAPLAILSICATADAALIFRLLPHPPGTEEPYCYLRGISKNAQFIAGDAYDSPDRNLGVVWDPLRNPSFLPWLGGLDEVANAVSDDGTILAGISDYSAIVWTPGGIVVVCTGRCTDIDGQGDIVVGCQPFWATGRGFVYSVSGTLEFLPPLDGFRSSAAWAVNRSGTIAVGSCINQAGEQRACMWSFGRGSPVILDSQGHNARALDVSDDGSVVVGYADTGNGVGDAIRWENGVYRVLTTGGAKASGVSDDGRTVVGESDALDAFIWDADHGPRSLKQIVSDSGVDLSNTRLSIVDGLSGDGRVIIGTGIRTDPWAMFQWELRLDSCRADFNADFVLDFFDYLDFVALYDAQDPRADFNGDQQIDAFDYLDFVAAFEAGCD